MNEWAGRILRWRPRPAHAAAPLRTCQLNGNDCACLLEPTSVKVCHAIISLLQDDPLQPYARLGDLAVHQLLEPFELDINLGFLPLPCQRRVLLLHPLH